MYTCTYTYIYICIYVYYCLIYHGLVSRAFLLHGKALHVAVKKPILHGVARTCVKATAHAYAWITYKWIPNFTDLHGTAWKVLVHIYPTLALLMELNSYESHSSLPMELHQDPAKPWAMAFMAGRCQ